LAGPHHGFVPTRRAHGTIAKSLQDSPQPQYKQAMRLFSYCPDRLLELNNGRLQ
jgi:hypothetical protein